MASFAFIAPLLPGKEQKDREMMQRFASGDDRDAYAASRRSLGIQRETVWHQATPDGTVAIVVWEAEDIEAAFGGIATSDEPFDRHFREFLQDVHGLDVANDPPPEVELIVDTRF